MNKVDDIDLVVDMLQRERPPTSRSGYLVSGRIWTQL